MTALIPFIIKYLPALMSASKSVPQIVEFIKGLQDIFKREKLWTPEQEKAFDDSLEELKKDPAWQPET